MAPLADYPTKPAKGETNGYDKLEEYDRTVEANIEEAYEAGVGAVQSDNKRLPITLTQAQYENLTPVPGQVYLITRG